MTNRLLRNATFKIQCHVPVRELQAPQSASVTIRKASPTIQLARMRADYLLRIPKPRPPVFAQP